MSRSTAVAIRFARAWIAGYTRGLDAQTRAERVAELESDLWEHSRDAAPGQAILLRCLLGIPADLSWRMEQANPGAAITAFIVASMNRAEATVRWMTRRGLPRLTTIVATLAVLIGVLLILTAPGSADRTPGESIVGGALFIAAGAFMLAGLQAAAAQPRAGAILVTLGVAPVALVFWQSVVVPIVAVALIASAWANTRRRRIAT
jgi:hypothetical protein